MSLERGKIIIYKPCKICGMETDIPPNRYGYVFCCQECEDEFEKRLAENRQYRDDCDKGVDTQ